MVVIERKEADESSSCRVSINRDQHATQLTEKENPRQELENLFSQVEVPVQLLHRVSCTLQSDGRSELEHTICTKIENCEPRYTNGLSEAEAERKACEAVCAFLSSNLSPPLRLLRASVHAHNDNPYGDACRP